MSGLPAAMGTPVGRTARTRYAHTGPGCLPAAPPSSSGPICEWPSSMPRETGEDLTALRIVSAVPILPQHERRLAIESLLPAADAHPVASAHAHMTIANLAFEQSDWEIGNDAARTAAQVFRAQGDQRLALWAQYFEAVGQWGADVADLDDLLADVVSGFRRARRRIRPRLRTVDCVTPNVGPDAGRAPSGRVGEPLPNARVTHRARARHRRPCAPRDTTRAIRAGGTVPRRSARCVRGSREPGLRGAHDRSSRCAARRDRRFPRVRRTARRGRGSSAD